MVFLCGALVGTADPFMSTRKTSGTGELGPDRQGLGRGLAWWKTKLISIVFSRFACE
jgi:hypothetical protein